MKLIVSKNKSLHFNRILEFLLYLVLYTAAFMLIEWFFDSCIINSDYKVIWAALAVCIIYCLDKVVKPILVTLTIPLTGLTFGLFYFVINTIILKFADWIMLSKLDFTDIWVLFFISIVLSVLNFLIEKLIIEPILKKVR